MAPHTNEATKNYGKSQSLDPNVTGPSNGLMPFLFSVRFKSDGFHIVSSLLSFHLPFHQQTWTCTGAIVKRKAAFDRWTNPFITLLPTNMATDRGSLQKELLFQVPPHRCHVSWRKGIPKTETSSSLAVKQPARHPFCSAHLGRNEAAATGAQHKGELLPHRLTLVARKGAPIPKRKLFEQADHPS